jgi:hypothetical protein
MAIDTVFIVKQNYDSAFEKATKIISKLSAKNMGGAEHVVLLYDRDMLIDRMSEWALFLTRAGVDSIYYFKEGDDWYNKIKNLIKFEDISSANLVDINSRRKGKGVKIPRDLSYDSWLRDKDILCFAPVKFILRCYFNPATTGGFKVSYDYVCQIVSDLDNGSIYTTNNYATTSISMITATRVTRVGQMTNLMRVAKEKGIFVSFYDDRLNDDGSKNITHFERQCSESAQSASEGANTAKPTTKVNKVLFVTDHASMELTSPFSVAVDEAATLGNIKYAE